METENEALLPCNRDFPGGSEGKVSGCSFDLIPRSGRPPGEGISNSYLENPHGQRSLAGYSPWGHKE